MYHSNETLEIVEQIVHAEQQTCLQIEDPDLFVARLHIFLRIPHRYIAIYNGEFMVYIALVKRIVCVGQYKEKFAQCKKRERAILL
jgi:hypothetical protein